VLVKFRTDASAQARRVKVAAMGHSVLSEPDRSGWMRLKAGSGQSVAEAMEAYRNDPNVESVQPNYVYRISAAPDDPQYGQLWAFKNTGQTITTGTSTWGPNPGTAGCDMNIESAWEHRTDCSGVVVAVLDTGVNYDQEDLSGNMWNGGATYPNHGYDFVNDDNDPVDLNGHGTHVAGIIGAAGNNGAGTTGVCWSADIMAVRVLDASGTGYTSDITQGIYYAVNRGARVINMSLGGSGYDGLFYEAIQDAQSSGVVVVVAAGNDAANNDSTPTYPCNYSLANIICVAALDQSYGLASFSNYGATSVDVGAPGVNIRSGWAGTPGTVTDGLSSGWTESSGTGWAYGTPSFGGTPTPSLVNPASYPGGQYANSAEDRVWKSFDLSGVDGAVLNVTAAVNVRGSDYFRIVSSAGAGDPFSDPTLLASYTYASTYPVRVSDSWDISDCAGGNCAIGFRLTTNASSTDIGVAVTAFEIETLTLTTTGYATASGTSMARPKRRGWPPCCSRTTRNIPAPT
jgi:subtilisin family serine protease